ncbi:MAG TPA: response regulator [Gemmatimonadales bacterium]
MPRPDSSLNRFVPYLLALIAVLIMVIVRMLLTPILGSELPFITLFPAVFFAAWAGGLGPALAATVVSAGLALYLFFPPEMALDTVGIVAPLGAGLFILTGVAAGWLGRARLQAQERTETAAREAKKSEERYRVLIEQTAEGVWRIELPYPVPVTLPAAQQIDHFYAQAELAECNDAMAHMYGFQSATELVGARLGDLMPRSDPRNLEFLQAFIANGYRLTDAESHERDREGGERYFLNNLIGIVEDRGVVRAWGSQRDVTTSKRTEAAVAASEARFRSVFESGMIGIGFWNGGVVTDANDALLQILGYSCLDLEEGVLRHGRLTPPGYEEADARAREQVRVTGTCTPYEKEFFRKDGSRVSVLAGGARLGPDMDDAVFFVLDQTDRRVAEERLRHAEQLEVVGQLAGGMAHEANNQMSVVLGATEFILRRADVPSAVRQDAEYIREAAERTASITRQLLAFSRRQILQPQAVDLNTAVRKLEPILRRTLTEEQGLKLQLASNLAAVRADRVQLDQVLLNLAINARDAMPNGGTLTVETRNVRLTDRYLAGRPGINITPGPYVALVVSDTGVGIEKEAMKHLFEPFFTTKGVGKGSGLGLAMVYGIVKQSDGYIWPYSEPGMGSTFKIYLPAVSDAPHQPSSDAPEESEERESATVLVVEDDPLVRTMARRSLAEAGFDVLEAANGREALALIMEHEEVDAVLTDLAMPELGGQELARRLSELRPGLPVIFMSGYTDDDLTRRGLLAAGTPYLEKPFSPEALGRMLRAVLSPASPSN